MHHTAAWEWQKEGAASRVWQEVDEKGWTLVRWPEAAARTERDPNAFCAELLERSPVNHRFAKLQIVAGVDKGYEQTKGPAELHTDQHPYLPAQIQVLACVNPAGEGGESTFVDLWKVVSRIEKEDPALFRGLFVPRAVVFGRSVWLGGTVSLRHDNLVCVHPAIRPSPEDEV